MRKGVRASRLVYVPELLDVLVLPDENGQTSSGRLARAIKAEAMLIEACEHYDSPSSDALKALFGLTGDHAAPLYRRRKIAGAFFDVRPRTFTKNYEDDLIMDLAAELWRIVGRE